MTDNTERGLLDDIIANPADDVPRLIYADYLEERGDEERAEFIRVQIELNQYPECNTIGRHCTTCEKLKKVERYWVEVNRASLTASIPFDVGLWRQIGDALYVPTAFFRRGFLAEIHAPLAVLREHLPRLVQEQPIGAVRVTDREPFELPSELGFRWLRGSDTVHPSNQTLRRASIPLRVWKHMPDDRAGCKAKEWLALDYPTAHAAHAALSAALLRRAKAHPLTRLEG